MTLESVDRHYQWVSTNSLAAICAALVFSRFSWWEIYSQNKLWATLADNVCHLCFSLISSHHWSSHWKFWLASENMGCNQSSAKEPVREISQPPSSLASQEQQLNAQGGAPITHKISVTSYNGSLHGQGSPHSPLSSIPEPTVDPEKIFVACYAYQARTSEDLSFEKGEQLTVSCWLGVMICSTGCGILPKYQQYGV